MSEMLYKNISLFNSNGADIPVKECNLCGALTQNAGAHIAWHKGLEDQSIHSREGFKKALRRSLNDLDLMRAVGRGHTAS